MANSLALENKTEKGEEEEAFRGREAEEMKYRCVECGFGTKTLFVQYSPGNIRLMKCENCKAIADEYIECEFMIILIDLILHKPKAYRHILYNVLNQETVNLQGLLWKFAIGFLLLDAYRSLLLQRNEEEHGFSLSFSSLVWRSQKIFMDVFAGNLMFLCIFVLATRILLNKPVGFSRFGNLLLAILVSSYFKIFLVSMMVWEFPSSVIFIIDLFVLSSNAVALKGAQAMNSKQVLKSWDEEETIHFASSIQMLLAAQLLMLVFGI